MKILITGGSGAIGKSLVDTLIERGYSVRLLTRDVYLKKNDSKKEFCAGDVRDIKSLHSATLGIDTIIHLAGITHTNTRKLYYEINTVGTKNLIEAAKRNSVKRFIFISSRTAGADAGAYALSKLLAENEIMNSGLRWLILRPSEVYGGDEGEAIQILLAILQKGKRAPVIGNGTYLLSPVHRDDVVDAVVSALERTELEKKIYILSGPEEMTYLELIERLSKITGKKAKKIFIPVVIAKIIAALLSFFPQRMLVRDQIPRLLSKKSSDITLAVKDFGYHPRSLEDGIHELLKRKKQEGV